MTITLKIIVPQKISHKPAVRKKTGRRLVLIILIFCAAVLLAGSAVTWNLISTEAGLIRLLKISQFIIPGTLQWRSVEGNLHNGFVLRELQYQDANVVFRAEDISAQIRLAALFRKQLYLESLHAKQIEITVISENDTLENEFDLRNLLEDFPIDLIANQVEIENIHVNNKEQTLFVANRIVLDAQWNSNGIEIVRHTLTTDYYQMKAHGEFSFDKIINGKLVLEWQIAIPDYTPVSGSSILTGNLEQLYLDNIITSPANAQVNLHITDLFGTMKWESIISANDTPLNRIQSDLPSNFIGGDLHAYGDTSVVNIDGQLRSDFIDLPQSAVDIHTRLSLTDEAINIMALQLELPDNTLDITGKGTWLLTEEKFQAQFNWQSLRWPLQGKADFVSPSGTGNIIGSLQDYTVNTKFRVNVQDIDAGTWKLKGSGNLRQFTLISLLAESFNGYSKAQGEVAWQPHLSWQLALEGYDLDPAFFSPEWPGRIDFVATSTGTIRNGDTQISVNIEQLEGAIINYPVVGLASANYDGKILHINKLELASRDNQLSVNGSYGEKIELAWQAEAKQLSILSADLQGQIKAAGTFRGDLAALVSEGRLKATSIAINDIKAELIDLQWNSTLNDKLPFSLQLTSTAVTAYQETFEHVKIDGSGSMENHKFTVSAVGDNTGLALHTTGKWLKQTWQGRLSKADWHLPEVGQWTLASPVELKLSKKEVDISNACWNKENAHICLETHGQVDANMNSKLSIKDLPIALFTPWFPDNFAISGVINADMDINTPSGGASVGTGNIELPPGKYSFASGDGVAPHLLTYTGGTIAMQLDAQGFSGKGQIRLKDDNGIQIDWNLANFQHAENLQNQTIDLTIEAKLNDLAFIDALLIDVNQLKGEMLTRLTIVGTLSTPIIRGESHWKNGSLRIPSKGLLLEKIDINVVESDKDTFSLQGSANSESGHVKLVGTVTVPDLHNWQATLDLQGERFEIVDLPSARILISPELSAKIKPGLIVIDGQVIIPEAQLKPRELQDAVVNSSDVIIVDEQEEPAKKTTWAISSRIKLIMGDKIWLEGFGLKGWINGDMNIIDEPDKAILGRGELAIRDGSFQAYGSDLKIERGKLTFRGGPIDDPGLDVVATRKIEAEQIKVGVKVSGTLLKPKIDTYSEPAMAQTETLSYLMFGKASDKASAGHQEMLLNTVSNIAGSNNTWTNDLKERFGLSEIRFTGGWSKEDSALTLGKYLSPRLFIGYTFGLFESVDEFNMRYKLSDNWSLEMETATNASSGDIYYSFER